MRERQKYRATGSTESQEMYLATIYKVYKKRGSAYLSAVAEERGCSKPSAFNGVKTLEESGYIVYDNGKITLTKSGLEKAKDIEEKHNTLAAAFELLGVEKAEAEENACRMEHVISDNVHKRLYVFVKDKQGETPSVEKQGECFDLLLEYFTLSGCSKSNIQRYVEYWQEKGELSIENGEYETAITRATEKQTIAVPKLGCVPCGPLSEEYECIDGYVRLPASFVGNSKKCFLLTASGNSMIDAGISDGDLVLVRQQETAEYNDIVVALVGNEVTLKRYRPDITSGKIILHLENKRMKDIAVTECKIQGVAIRAIKNLENKE